MPRRAAGPGWALAAILAALCTHCMAEKREVYSCREMWEALSNTQVDHIVAMRNGSFNCTAASLPPSPLPIFGREVLLEGEGPGLVYIDFNQHSSLIGVAQGGSLTVRNLWLDDCLGAEDSAICIASVLESGSMTLADMRMSDTACVNAQRSSGIAEVHNLVRFTLGKKRYSRYIDDRTMYVADTGWLIGAVATSRWRVVNTSFDCTGNITHALPEGFVDVELGNVHPALLAAGGATLLVLTGGLIWCSRRGAANSSAPEYKIAESRGFVLEEPLGSGHFGRVYRARKKSTGQQVAVKVIDLLPNQRRRVIAAYRECQILSSMQHDCILRVVTFYTAKVQRRKIVEMMPDSDYIEVGYQPPGQLSSSGLAYASGESGSALATPSSLHDSSSSGQMVAPHQASSKAGGSGAAPAQLLHQRSSTGASTGTGGSSSLGSHNAGALGDDRMEGVLSIQVQLVTQYCDMGTLEQAVKAGMFRDGAGQPKLRHMLLTALEIARGVEYLQQRRMIHRDLSANNVLLTTSTADDRGFRAVLSDFGLSTVLSEEQTHKTSQVKGTISYMSPELFIRDDVSPSLDIYSLGVILYLMFSGRDPYHGQKPAMIILSKVRENARLPLLEGCPDFYQQLVHDCTLADRRARPTAAEVVQRLLALLMAQ